MVSVISYGLIVALVLLFPSELNIPPNIKSRLKEAKPSLIYQAYQINTETIHGMNRKWVGRGKRK